jgi:hypothetical protein
MRACHHRHLARALGDLLFASTNAPLDTPSTLHPTLDITNTLFFSPLVVLCANAGMEPLLSKSRP